MNTVSLTPDTECHGYRLGISGKGFYQGMDNVDRRVSRSIEEINTGKPAWKNGGITVI
ncbi:hypothetical protein SAMN04489751_1112 [Brevibacterium sandarakinum]|uniref:Uncharacterized protein n=1 Tax=Brevibacterium sandarakinum TaxID=629680 RepID=A0A1H1P1T9_BRESA|nr:hypothetical protein [Brevibacterium sandarakinum]SDS05187.1 hypothetical protein SAMN04489751_1112 [Brevibacterium sandarakinum]